MKVAVSGIPRGYQFPRADGNWLKQEHKEQILAISERIELIEIPAHDVVAVDGVEILLAEGGNRSHYPGELDWDDYRKFFRPSLRWVQLCSTGFSANITPQVLDGTVTLTNAAGLHTIPVAESVLAAMLDHGKRLAQRRLDQKAHRWGRLDNDELSGRTVLIIGLGEIAKRVARLCKAFDMTVIGTRRTTGPVAQVDEVFPVGALIERLAEADYVVVAVPHTPETEGMLGAEAFRAMKPSAYFINVGRGQVVDEPVMIEALRERRLAGAYLDALAEEPLPEDHVLWDMENVFIVPHDSHSSPFIGDRMVDIFCDNLRRYVASAPLKNVCDPERGY
jgi:phosphoglycerate dehydrogenase-like enzyme